MNNQLNDDLLRRQEEHLRSISERQKREQQNCLHNSCPQCIGTGVKKDGSGCIHMISCPCSKCTPHYF